MASTPKAWNTGVYGDQRDAFDPALGGEQTVERVFVVARETPGKQSMR
ncbi:MAG: hypothetical protein Q7U22_04985 [Pararhizobium sp.]|nr:hypothetical protein [Pararhizobium sp.]MDO9415454.1 hypothetical protein [Pararhizobium sp.]